MHDGFMASLRIFGWLRLLLLLLLFCFVVELCHNFPLHTSLSSLAMEPDRDHKRPRPEDFQGGGGGGGGGAGEVYSRIHLNQSLFAKVIGKGGAMINQIRQQCGAYMKGVDVNEEERMVGRLDIYVGVQLTLLTLHLSV
jgi:hypothetical protein